MNPVSLSFTLFFIHVCLFLQGQMTINSSYFPSVGDTLYLATDNLPRNIDLHYSGENIDWDFSMLQSPFINKIVFTSPTTHKTASGFETATTAHKTDLLTTFFQESEESFNLLGVSGADPLDFGINLDIRYFPPLPERYAPLQYGDQREAESAASVPFSVDQLPTEILERLPIVPDSLRIRINITRLSNVDAHGRVLLPDGVYYTALREKRTEIRHINLDAKLGIFPWQDISALVPGTEALGTLETVSYHFYNSGSKEAIASVIMDPNDNTPLSILYKATDFTTPVRATLKGKPEVTAFPNPAIANVRFDFSNIPPGNYELKLFNILVQEVYSKQHYISGPQTIQVDISQLRKGTYLYSLVDEKGKTLGTKRLIVLRP